MPHEFGAATQLVPKSCCPPTTEKTRTFSGVFFIRVLIPMRDLLNCKMVVVLNY